MSGDDIEYRGESFDCSQCDTVILGVTRADLEAHGEECNPLVSLYE